MVTSAPLTPVELDPAAMIFSGRPLSRACSTLTSAVKPKWYSPLITAGTAPVEAMLALSCRPCFFQMPTSSPR